MISQLSLRLTGSKGWALFQTKGDPIFRLQLVSRDEATGVCPLELLGTEKCYVDSLFVCCTKMQNFGAIRINVFYTVPALNDDEKSANFGAIRMTCFLYSSYVESP